LRDFDAVILENISLFNFAKNRMMQL